jgi:hypothetical protein
MRGYCSRTWFLPARRITSGEGEAVSDANCHPINTLYNAWSSSMKFISRLLFGFFLLFSAPV